MTKQVFLADNGVAISEGYNSLDELLEVVTSEQTYNFIEVVWEDGATRRLTHGVDY
ncbi:hypothetical protein [Enterococcus sp. AZ101]|uniref:hypothetical protein n=1 Tax=Enterococcus sp. AZ101 TaxID=2774742 RepID=UPI003D26597D